jgi:hypothetical protein
MSTVQKLQALATEKNTPCVSILLNTHRTHPDNVQDVILLKNLLKEAEERVLNEFEDSDEEMGIFAQKETTVSFRIAFNTLLKNNILIEENE